MDYGRSGPALDPVFGVAFDGWYWSSTSQRENCGWVVDFSHGNPHVDAKHAAVWYVLAVRGGQ